MKIHEIPDGQVWHVDASQFEALLTGAAMAGFYPDGSITLTYTDGETETGKFDLAEAQAIADKSMETIIPVVSAVQSKRSPEATRADLEG